MLEYINSLPLDAQVLLVGVGALVLMVLLAGVINVIETIFPHQGVMPWDYEEDDDYTGADWSDHA